MASLAIQLASHGNINGQVSLVMFEFETVLAFGVGAGLVALAPVVRRMGNPQLGDSMSSVGKTMAKRGIKVGVTVAGVATKAAQSVASHAAEAAESFVDLIAEARSEMAETAADPVETQAEVVMDDSAV